MNNKLKHNIVKITDIVELKKIFLSFLRQENKTQKNFEEYIQKLIMYANNYVLYNNQDIPVSYCCFYSNDRLSQTGFITAFKTDEAHRGKGYGSVLLNYTFDKMLSSGMKTCRLEVSADNVKARHLYERFGFIYLSEPASQEGFLRMEKKL